MKRIVFTEEFCQPQLLYPFTLTRQIQDIRVGMLTLRERWEAALRLPSFDLQEGDYKDGSRSVALSDLQPGDTWYLIHGNLLPDPGLAKAVLRLKKGECLSVPDRETPIYCLTSQEVEGAHKARVKKVREWNEPVRTLKYPWDVTAHNAWAIGQDLVRMRGEAKRGRLTDSNRVINPRQVFMEAGAKVEASVLNATEGPILIAKGAVVQEGCLLRGPLAIGPGAVLKMGTRIYGASSIGPYCTVGGEIKNSVLFSHSNKAHDGYLGDSVIGSWCNLGAGTSNSNVKNTAAEVEVWTPNGPVNTGLKCGVMMGDYSRAAINTSINTGTVVGACCNLFGRGLTPKYIPSFSWGYEGIERYRWEAVLRDIGNWKGLKGERLEGEEIGILKHIFDHY